jgi:hypothetical protein
MELRPSSPIDTYALVEGTALYPTEATVDDTEVKVRSAAPEAKLPSPSTFRSSKVSAAEEELTDTWI